MEAKAVVQELGSDLANGLKEAQVSDLRSRYGENKLKEKKKKTNFQRFIDQFKDVMILILIAAAAISFAIACTQNDPEEFFEPILILVIVIVNAIIGTIQESNAEKALDALKSLSAPHARVIRDGEAVVRPFFDADYFIWRDYGYQWICPGTDEGDLHASFNLHLRTISRDFYNYLRALNNLQTYGYDVIPIIEPTILPNNVTGGYGLVSVGADRTVTFDLGTRHIVHDASEGIYYGY